MTLHPRTTISELPNLYPLSQNGRTYLDANLVISAAVEAGLPVRLDGWKNPQLHLGAVTLHLGTSAAPTDAYNIYAQFIGNFAVTALKQRPGTVSVGSFRWNPLGIHSRYGLGTYGRPGEVYALVAIETVQGHPTFSFDVAPVNEAGRLGFQLPYGLNHLRVVSSLQELQKQWPREGSSEAPAILLRMNNDTRDGVEYVVQPLTRTLENLGN